MQEHTALFMFAAIIAGLGLLLTACPSHFKEKAIIHGCAAYDSTTGDFVWLDPTLSPQE